MTGTLVIIPWRCNGAKQGDTMKRIVAAALAVLILAGCSIESKYSEPLGKLRNMVRDPDTVQLRGLRESVYQGDTYLCGEVNAKNAYGAYVGYERFVSDKYGYDIHLDRPDDKLFRPKWNTFCGD